MDTIVLQKQQLREQLKQRRGTLDKTSRASYSQQICETLFTLDIVNHARSVFCFISFADEIHTHGIIDRLMSTETKVCIPHIYDGETMVAVSFQGWDGLEPGKLGILSSLNPQLYEDEISVCLTPGLGFSTNGARIGMGKGYYDRWLQAHPEVTKIGLGFSCQLDTIPMTESDVFMDMIVTEQGVIRVNR